MLSKYNHANGKIRHTAVLACLVPLCTVHGCAITTTEGIGNTKTRLHPVQERLALGHGTQCGFCSPGMVMSMYTLLRNNPKPSKRDVERAIEGNLCRCTGYRPILHAFNTFAKESECPMGKDCCKNKTEQTGNNREEQTGINSEEQTGNNRKEQTGKTREEQTGSNREEQTGSNSESFQAMHFDSYDSNQEPIFPSELQLNKDFTLLAKFTGSRVTWYIPTTVTELLQIKKEHPNAHIVAGNTGVMLRPNGKTPAVVISVANVPDLTLISLDDNAISIGAAVTVSELEEFVNETLDKAEGDKKTMLNAVSQMTANYGSKQIRNMATVGGSICHKAPWSDILPFLVATKASLTVKHKDCDTVCERMCNPGYSIANDELLLQIKIPFGKKQYISYKKYSERPTFDTSVVNMTVVMEVDEDNVIRESMIVIGGEAVQHVLVMDKTIDERLITYSLQNIFDKNLKKCLPQEIPEHITIVIKGLFFKCIVQILTECGTSSHDYTVFEGRKLGEQKGTCVYEETNPEQPADDPIGRPVAHQSAIEHVTGTAVYVDDYPQYKDELHIALVKSTCAHAKIIDINAEDALSVDGVLDFLCYKDVPGQNRNSSMIPEIKDEEAFAEEVVGYVGQVVGAIVADNRNIAKIAAAKVDIKYEVLSPIITIEDAVKAKTNLGPGCRIEKGNVKTGFDQSDHIIEGECYSAGQEHFYMETHSILAVPLKEKDEITVYCSSQNISFLQSFISSVLGIAANKIVVKAKRAGGGFGGKEFRTVIYAAPCVIAAYKYGKPVRCILDRYEDMQITGGRHSVHANYKVGFMRNGQIVAAETHMELNGGYTTDVSPIAESFSSLMADGAYCFPNRLITSSAYRTNISSNTACRGFGAPLGQYVCEMMMSHVAEHVGMPLSKIQEMHLLQPWHETTWGEVLENCTGQKCWDECLEKSDFYKRQQEVQKFNKENKWKKRGIAAVPIMQSMGFPFRFLNQASALVQVYSSDGSVLLAHGGIELGQGLFTKTQQIASRVLEIPMEMIHIAETSTDSVPNSSTTAGSCATDLNGGAVKKACETILKRLEPYKLANPSGLWRDWVGAAYMDQVNLSAVEHYCIPDINMDLTKKGRARPSYGHGAGCTEVEIDCLTGIHYIRRVDIVCDVGKSLNPSIDIGQIEGAYLMGYGYHLMEDIKFNKEGKMETCGIHKYKLPSVGQVPQEFNVHLLKDKPQTTHVYSSKGIGEPPLLIGISALHAVMDAIRSARIDQDLKGFIRIDSPVTPAKIRLACAGKDS